MEEVRQAYGALAEPYIELYGTTDSAHPDDLALIERHLSVRPGTVLDVGCGPGHLTAHLRLRQVDAVGFDLVSEFIDHARSTHPDGRYGLGAIEQLPVSDGSAAGLLAWYSLIHVPPEELDAALSELRRVASTDATLVVGFFHGEVLAPFEHQVVTAHYWPIEELSARLARAGFAEIDRVQRPGRDAPGHRPQAAIAAAAT